MGLTAKEYFMLFPTGLFAGMIPDVTLCDRVEAKIREMQKAGLGDTAATYLRSYMTPDDLQTLPEMKELVDLILDECKAILDIYKIKRDSHYITSMWANVTSPNRRHNTHVHANSLLSGILYIRTPKGCGRTIFFSPRHLASAIMPEFTEKNDFNAETFAYPVQKGRMVIWPSYLPHSVDNGNAEDGEDRIVVAFNVMIRGRIDEPTVRLNLS